ncbi:MAG TPA: ABC transporter substrate-binding protein [Acidimicrobiales bacterium]|jgi:branched-chain amino acid transport system substrate-binding protein|nr:ABC transporter substrate-binding protein [Acidimicrobiales bacterium]
MGIRWRYTARLLAVVGVAAAASVVPILASSAQAASPTRGVVTAAKSSKAPIVVGSIVSVTGEFGSEEGVQTTAAAKAWQTTVNNTGGIDGHPVKVIVMDDQANPTVAAQDADTLLNQDHAVAIVGPETGTTSWYPTIEQMGIPCIGGICGSAIFFDNPKQKYFFSVGTSSSAQITSTVAAAKAVKAKKVGVVACAETVSCTIAAQLFESAAKNVGLTYGGTQSVSASASSYAAPCLALKQAGVDSVQLDVAAATAIRVMGTCQQQGYTPHYISVVQIADKASIKTPAFNKLIVVSSVFPWFAKATPAQRQFQVAINKQVPKLSTFSPAYGEYTAVTWSAFIAFQGAAQAALSKGKSLTGANIASALQTSTDPTLGGLVGTMDWSQPTTKQGNCFFTIGVRNGKFTQPLGSKPQCVKS